MKSSNSTFVWVGGVPVDRQCEHFRARIIHPHTSIECTRHPKFSPLIIIADTYYYYSIESIIIINTTSTSSIIRVYSALCPQTQPHGNTRRKRTRQLHVLRDFPAINRDRLCIVIDHTLCFYPLIMMVSLCQGSPARTCIRATHHTTPRSWYSYRPKPKCISPQY